jgi:cell division transport system ATP-binding protein
LDEDSADTILELLKRFHLRGATVIVATHDKELMRKTGGRALRLNQGYLQKITNI